MEKVEDFKSQVKGWGLNFFMEAPSICFHKATETIGFGERYSMKNLSSSFSG